jgi:hypothetical protein
MELSLYSFLISSLDEVWIRQFMKNMIPAYCIHDKSGNSGNTGNINHFAIIVATNPHENEE